MTVHLFFVIITVSTKITSLESRTRLENINLAQKGAEQHWQTSLRHLPAIFVSGLSCVFDSEKCAVSQYGKKEMNEFLVKGRREGSLREVDLNKWNCQINSAFPSGLYNPLCVSWPNSKRYPTPGVRRWKSTIDRWWKCKAGQKDPLQIDCKGGAWGIVNVFV